MVVKNIVNIQNNKLDFDINGSNKLKFTFRGTENFRLTEVGGTSHTQFIAHKALTDELFERQITEPTNADFIGRISNINNHTINNLKDVDATNAIVDHALIYDGENWVAGDVTATLKFQDNVGGTAIINLKNDTFKILGTDDEIETIVEASSTAIRIGLPSKVIITNELFVGTTNTGAALINTNTNNEAIFKNNQGDANSGIILGTNGNVTIDSNNFIVNSNTTINGNLTVNGTQTIINTEIKLIEDSLIELGYAGTNSLPFDQDIGFFGQYINNNYAGLYYDVSAAAFKVFDSLGTNDYETSLATNPNGNIVTTNARAANIEAKNFITSSGNFGQEVFSTTLVKPGPGTNPLDVNIIDILQNEDVYGTGNGIFSGKLLSYIYKDDFSESASSLINYSIHIGGTNPTDKVLASSVELETKVGALNFIDFDSDNKIINVSLGTAATDGLHTFGVRLLPIFSARKDELLILPLVGGGAEVPVAPVTSIISFSLTIGVSGYTGLDSISIKEDNDSGANLLSMIFTPALQVNTARDIGTIASTSPTIAISANPTAAVGGVSSYTWTSPGTSGIISLGSLSGYTIFTGFTNGSSYSLNITTIDDD